MKRREAKFVHASPRLSPDQIEATPRVRETRVRPVGKRVLPNINTCSLPHAYGRVPEITPPTPLGTGERR